MPDDQRSTNPQLAERMDRERRSRAVQLQRDYAETLRSLCATAEAISAHLDRYNGRRDSAE